MKEKRDVEPMNDHIEYHVIHDNEQNENTHLQHDEPNFALYALIKYISTILIVIAVLYFIAVYVLPVVREFINK